MDKDNKQKYDPSQIENKWQKIWEEKGTYQPDLNNSLKPFYNLMMFPYPSAEGMHVGNMYAFTGADIYGRFKRMQGFDVFEPIGLDGFGIHSENYALKVGEHPKIVSKRTEENFYRQLRATGNSYAWKNTVETYDPDYYKWTQWIFVQLFKAGLAYRGEAPVNWCPSCKTVLADEQVIQGKRVKGKGETSQEVSTGVCERCGTEVEIKKLKQWFFRITSYADRLLENIKKLNWPQKVLLGQKNWIGESKGVEIIFKVEGKDIPIHVFTTRLDTIYGATALVIAPDKMGSKNNPFGLDIATPEYKGKVKEYIEQVKSQLSIVKSKGEEEEKTGVFTGAYAINPFSGERIPIWIANYVVGWYGTGALMVVPAHDERDFEFAKKYNIPIRPVIKRGNYFKALILKDSVSLDFGKRLSENNFKTSISTTGNYQVELDSLTVDNFISFIKSNIKKDFWVEIVGAKTIFIFGSGEVLEIKSIEDEEAVFKKCKKLEPSIKGLFDIWDMLTDVDFYNNIICTLDYGILINSAEFTG